MVLNLNTIFRKQFVMYMGAMCVSFLLFGFILTGAFSSFFDSRKIEMLNDQCEKIAELYVRISYSDRNSPLVHEQLINEISYMNRYLEATCFITDARLQVLTSIEPDAPKGVILDSGNKKLRDLVAGTPIALKGTLNNLFSDPKLVVALPVIINGNTNIAVFLISPLSELQATSSDAARLILLLLLLFAGVMIILIYVASRRITRPILKINEAAKVIAGGDFEKRLEVESDDEIGQLADSFNEMADSLYNQEKTRREFIGNVSHDLRSPLTSIKGFIQAMLDKTIPGEYHDHYLNVVLEETERLSKLANDVLDLSKLQDVDVELRKSVFDINELIRKTIILFENRITQKLLDVTVSFANEKNSVIADQEKIQRVISNLIDNAIKFTDERGQISIITSVVDDKLEIKVKDTGRGISPDDQKRIFERFYKTDASRGEDKSGSGLGLAIVLEFVKAHGQAVLVNSEPGNGCEFAFTLELV